jgi:hypothetical protein
MLKEEVDDEDIAEVISRWTGIPVSRMLEGEREKLVQMESRVQRVIGQEQAIERSPMPCAGRAPASRTPIAPSAPLSSWAPPASAKPNWPRPWPNSFSTPSRPWCAST